MPTPEKKLFKSASFPGMLLLISRKVGSEGKRFYEMNYVMKSIALQPERMKGNQENLL
jgi:hypothetical protein